MPDLRLHWVTRAFDSPGAPPAQPPAGPPPELPKPEAAKSASEDVLAKLKQLKELRDADLITDADFEEQKKRLLSQL